MTESEKAFEKILELSEINFSKIPEGESLTPDYEVIIESGLTYWEIKELEENEHEKEILSKVENNEGSVYSVNSRRIEGSIKKACAQFKGYCVTGFPCVVILYDSRDFLVMDLAFTAHLKTAMLGSSEYIEDASGELVEVKRNNGLLTNRKRYVSAVGVINYSGNSISIFHNPYATQPIAPHLLSAIGAQYMSVETTQGLSWREI